MAIKHFEHPCTVHFMGSHPGTFNIDRDDEAMTIKGEAIVNGTLDADFDIDKDGNISGGAKGILTWDGKATNWQ